MVPKKYDYCVFIGRFAPFHNGHKTVLEHALQVSKKVIVVLGSCRRPLSIKNPFLDSQRELLIKMSASCENVIFVRVNDHVYNDQRWTLDVQSLVDNAIENDGNDPDVVTIGITGNKKDSSSFYLDLFPQWEYVNPPFVKMLSEYGGGDMTELSATNIREILFDSEFHVSEQMLKSYVHPEVSKWLSFWIKDEVALSLASEYGYIESYKKSWEKAPYPVTFVTVDAVVVQSGHILLVRRRAAPGKGLLALPGGFLDQNERIEDGVIRELREETKIKVPEPVLRGSIKKRQVFDAVDRSLRGRTITHAHLISLPNGELPRVKGSDDADKAFWVSLSEIKSENMFEDHYWIIQEMVGI